MYLALLKGKRQTALLVGGLLLGSLLLVAFRDPRVAAYVRNRPKGSAKLNNLHSSQPKASNSVPPVLPPSAARRAHLVANRGNEFGRAAIFETDTEWVNPTVLVLPVDDPERKYLLLASGNRNKIPTHFGPETLVTGLAGCYLESPLDMEGGASHFRCGTPMIPLDLPFPEGAPFAKCHQVPVLGFAITAAEDVRMYLADDGSPMLIYFSTHPEFCRGMSTIDARAAFPGLHDAYIDEGHVIPIKYPEPYRLVRDGQNEIEKNWAFLPSYDGSLTYYTTLSPHEVFSSRDQDDMPLVEQDVLYRVSEWPTLPLETNCIVHLTQDVEDSDDFFRSTPDKNHLGTPFLRLRFCKRDRCRKATPTVLIGIFNRKRQDFQYDTRVLVLQSTPPYTQISLSPPITFAGVSGQDFVYTHGLVWAEPNFEDDVLIGYLDDSVLISIGISNKQGGLVQVPVEELLASQMACTAGMFVM